MPLDEEVEKAVLEVVAQMGQPSTVSKRLVAWLTEMSENELSTEDCFKHLELTRAVIKRLD